jgi:CRP-like cAMP-binding protein
MAVTDEMDRVATGEECRRVFDTMAFFDVLSEADVEALAANMRWRDFVAGATIFYEDDESDAVYFLAEGAIEIFKSDQTGKKLPLAILRGDGLLGEMGLLNNTPRTATARALCQTRCLCLPAAVFQKALEDGSVPAHRLVLAFARMLAQRLSSMDERLFNLFENETDNERHRELNEFKQRLMTTWTGLSLDTHV